MKKGGERRERLLSKERRERKIREK